MTKIKGSFSCFKRSFTFVIFFLEMLATFFLFGVCMCERGHRDGGEGAHDHRHMVLVEV